MVNAKSISIGLSACFFMLAIIWGCSDKSKTESPGPMVAKVGKSGVSTTDLRQSIEARPPAKRDGDVDAAVRSRLDELILEEVLFQEAMARKLDQDPEVRKSIRQLLISKLIETRVEKPAWEENVTPEQIRAYYEDHRHEFERPEQVRLADILIAVPPDADKDERRALLQKAEKVFGEAEAAINKRGGFSRLIHRYSDTPAHYAKGDTGFIDQEGSPVGIDRRLAEAAFDIDKNGALAQQVIEADDGYHIIRRIGKRSAVNIPLNKVENNLVQRIKRERLETQRRNYLTALREKSGAQVNAQELAGIIREVEKMKASADKMEKSRLAKSGKGNTPPMFRGE